jgi:hypothetical protein
MWIYTSTPPYAFMAYTGGSFCPSRARNQGESKRLAYFVGDPVCKLIKKINNLNSYFAKREYKLKNVDYPKQTKSRIATKR